MNTTAQNKKRKTSVAKTGGNKSKCKITAKTILVNSPEMEDREIKTDSYKSFKKRWLLSYRNVNEIAAQESLVTEKKVILNGALSDNNNYEMDSVNLCRPDKYTEVTSVNDAINDNNNNGGQYNCTEFYGLEGSDVMDTVGLVSVNDIQNCPQSSSCSVAPITSGFGEVGEESTITTSSSELPSRICEPAYNIRGAMEFCDVQFYDRDVSIKTLKGFVYPKKLNLISLKEIVPEKFKIVPSSYGNKIRILTEAGLQYCKNTHSLTNDKNTDLTIYYLLYGAVPKVYGEVVKYLLKIFDAPYETSADRNGMTIQRKIYNSAEQTSIAATSDTIYLPEGQFEILLFNYWKLSCRDLIRWNSNVPQKGAKEQLAEACTYLPDGDVKTAITSLAQFNKNSLISTNCLSYIKRNFVSIAKLNKSNDATLAWQYFMKICNIHHFLCNHTLDEMYNQLINMGDSLRRDVCLIQTGQQDWLDTLWMAKEISKSLNRLILSNCDRQAEKPLLNAVDDLLIWYFNSLLSFLKESGIIPLCKEIAQAHVCGHVNLKLKDIIPQITERMVFISDSAAISQLEEYITPVINEKLATSNGSKFSLEAIEEILTVLQRLLRSSMSAEDDTLDRQDEEVYWKSTRWTMDNMQNIKFHSTNPRTASKNIEHGLNWKNHEDLQVEESSCTNIDNLEPSLENLDELLSNLNSHSQTKTIEVKPPRKKRNVSKKQMLSRIKPKAQYKFTKHVIVRTRCVLCFRCTTEKLVGIIKHEVHVPCCTYCLFELNNLKINKYVLIDRINRYVKAPICFESINTTRIFINEESLTKHLCRLTYNFVERKRIDKIRQENKKVQKRKLIQKERILEEIKKNKRRTKLLKK